MKKILTLIIFVVAIAFLNACGNTESGVLRVGMDLRYPPFESTDTENEPEGISVDIAYALGEYLGREVEIVNLDFSTLILSLNSGVIDIAIASMSITEERELSVDFTDPYFYFKIISLVNVDFADENNLTENSTVEDIVAIDDVSFVGITSQVSYTIPETLGLTVIETTSLGLAVEQIAQGYSDILLMSANPVVDGYNANSNTTIVVWDSFQSSPIGMAVAEGNTELLDQANAFIDTFSDQDGLYDVLKTSWDDVILEELGRYGLEFFITE
jgi:polar amino acid transport system substrate-binding protein